MPHYGGGAIGREEKLAGLAQANDIAHLPPLETSKTIIIQSLLQAGHTDNGLGLEGGGSFNGVTSLSHIQCQQGQLNDGGKFILTTLAGNLYGEGKTFMPLDTFQNSPGYLLLVWPQFNHYLFLNPLCKWCGVSAAAGSPTE